MPTIEYIVSGLDKTAEAAREAGQAVSSVAKAAENLDATKLTRLNKQIEKMIERRNAMLQTPLSISASVPEETLKNIGKAAYAYDSLGFAVQQVAREMPVFTFGLNTGFMALSNNLPILADAISQTRRQNEALAASGKKTVPVWKQIAGSLFSWQTALVAGITALTVYGDEIGGFISDLFNLSDAFDASEQSMKAVQGATDNYNTQLFQESARLRDIFERLKQTSEGTLERKQIIDQINSTYKDYLPYLLSEKSTIAELTTAYEALNIALRATAINKSRNTQLDKIADDAAKQQSDIIQELQQALREQDVPVSISDDIVSSLVADAPKWRDAGDTVTEAFLQAVKNIQEIHPYIRFDRNVRQSMLDYLSSLYAMESAMDAVNQHMDLMLGKNNQIKEIGEVLVTVNNPSNNTTGGNTTQRALNMDLSTIEGLRNKINQLRTVQEQSSVENAALLEREIRLYQEKLNLLQRTIAQQAAGSLAEGRYGTINAPAINALPVPATVSIPLQFDTATLQRSWQEALRIYSDSIKELEITGDQISGIVSNSLVSLASGIGEAVAADNGLEAMRSLLSSIMSMLQQFGSALIAAGVASQAFKSLFANPIAGIAAGAALVAAASAAKAALQNATAFADGAVVSGPTLALVGEYSGARNNPEVIAPLDKLRALIEPARPALDGLYLETRVKGKDLYVALRKTEHDVNRTR